MELDGYDEILDIYLMESILYLGKYHRRYFNCEQEIPRYGVREHISKIAGDGRLESSSPLIIPQSFWMRLFVYAMKLKDRIVRDGVWEHYRNIELSFAVNLYRLTRNGVTLDSNRLENIQQKFTYAMQKLLYALDVNNVNGTEIKDLNDWIRGYGFNEYFSYGRDEISMRDLALLENKHQVFKIFLRLNKLKRAKNLLDSIQNQQKIRPIYRTMGAVTGRCTSTNPNIMGIPKIFRPVVIPSRPDFGIVECDYSQMEVGVAAALSNDKNLINDFNTTDVYEKAGLLLFGCEGGDSRQKAKIIFLGIQYGLSTKTIAKRLEIPEIEAMKILRHLFSRYGALSGYLNDLEISGQDNGFVKNISGLMRFRRYPEREANYWERNWFKNFPIQSSAASVFKSAIIKICQEFRNEQLHLLVPLYDSIVFECPIDRLKEITGVVVDCMRNSMKEFFPMLKPKVTVNDSSPCCWNSDGKNNSIEKFLDDPLSDIDIREKPSKNVDWSNYL